MLGALFTLLSAATFGLNNAAVRRGVLTGSVMQALTVSMPIGALCFGIGALAFNQLHRIGEFSNTALVLLVLGGWIHFLFGRYCNYRAIKAAGATLSASIQQWTLLVSLVLAVGWLGESLSALKLLGLGLVVLGPVMTMRSFARRQRAAKSVGAQATSDAATPDPAKPVFEPNLVEGYVFSLLATIGYGVSPIVVRLALEDKGLALAGGFVSYAAATALIALALLLPGKLGHILALDRRSLPWFTMSGFTVFLSQAFRYLALGIAPVIVVAPIMRLSLVFRVIFSWFLNREYESFEPYVLWGIAVSFVGAMALTVNTGFVLDTIPMPPWLADIVAWQWPGP